MNAKVSAMNAANAKTWIRARKLCEHVEKTTPNQARSFLSENKTGPYPELLDRKKLDKRNPTVRAMLKEFEKFAKNHKGRYSKAKTNGQTPTTQTPTSRPSQGDPEQLPRAGAPAQGIAEAIKTPFTPKETLNATSLIKIKRLLDEIGGIENLEEGLRIIKTLTR